MLMELEAHILSLLNFGNFWTNHFTISDTQTLPDFSTGAYQREFIRANMDKTFETMAYEGTIKRPMI